MVLQQGKKGLIKLQFIRNPAVVSIFSASIWKIHIGQRQFSKVHDLHSSFFVKIFHPHCGFHMVRFAFGVVGDAAVAFSLCGMQIKMPAFDEGQRIGQITL